MTNLYDFLRRIHIATAEVTHVYGKIPDNAYIKIKVSADDHEFLNQYLQGPDVQIHFKARKTGEEVEGEPVYAQDYAIKGEPYEIFTLLTEAAMQNPVFCDMLFASNNFMLEHVSKCEKCTNDLNKARADFQNQVFDYTFKPHAK